MKVTEGTRVIKIAPRKTVHVRGDAVEALIDTRAGLNLCGLTECGLVQLEALRGNGYLR